MAIFKNRFASGRDIILVFSTCAFAIFAWSFLNMLYQVPAGLKQLNAWDLIGVIAYTQAFALIESAFVLLALVLLGALLPARLLRDKFVSQASTIVLLSSGWSILLYYNDQVIYGPRQELAFWFTTYLSSIGVFYLLIWRYKKVEAYVCSLAKRLLALSSVYIFIGFLSIIIVILRNV